MKTDLELICDLVRACGQFIKDIDREHLHVDAKSGRANFVTEYDKLVQERLRTGLLGIMPDAHFVGRIMPSFRGSRGEVWGTQAESTGELFLRLERGVQRGLGHT